MLYMRTYTFSFFFLVSELIRLIKNGLWCDALFFIIFFLFSPACSPQCCNCYHRNFSFYFYKRFFQEETRRKKIISLKCTLKTRRTSSPQVVTHVILWLNVLAKDIKLGRYLN